MITTTLFDVAAIMGLNPLGETFTPIIEIDQEFIIECFCFKNFIIDHHDKQSEEVSDQEHITFLTFWLS